MDNVPNTFFEFIRFSSTYDGRKLDSDLREHPNGLYFITAKATKRARASTDGARSIYELGGEFTWDCCNHRFEPRL